MVFFQTKFILLVLVATGAYGFPRTKRGFAAGHGQGVGLGVSGGSGLGFSGGNGIGISGGVGVGGAGWIDCHKKNF